MHSECLTGDVFGSQRCDCGPQLDEALERVVAAGRGVVVYLRGHEGRGIGLVAKLEAYALQDAGRDTVDANLDLGLPADARHYGTASQVLRDLGVTRVRLLTNNPDKSEALADFGITVEAQVPLTPRPNPHNLRYLRTKRDRMGHAIPDLPADERDTGRGSMSGAGAPADEPCRLQRPARRRGGRPLAHRGDGRPARRRPPCAGGVLRDAGDRGAGAGHLRAAGGGRRAGAHPRRGGGARASSSAAAPRTSTTSAPPPPTASPGSRSTRVRRSASAS